MRSVLVRPARATDLTALAPLAAQWFTTAFSGQVAEANLRPYVVASFSLERLAHEMSEPRSYIFVAEAQGALVGYVRLLEGQVPFDRSLAGTRIVRLYVESSLIGTGIGAALMRTSVEHAQGAQCSCLWLRVWEHNRNAIEFYTRWGFARRSLIDFEMLDGIKTDWLMSKSLE